MVVSFYQWAAWAPPSTCRVSPVTKVADSRYSTATKKDVFVTGREESGKPASQPK
jgi:hypothetical protein